MYYSRKIDQFRSKWNSPDPFSISDVAWILRIPYYQAKCAVEWAEGECIIAFFSYGYQFTDA